MTHKATLSLSCCCGSGQPRSNPCPWFSVRSFRISRTSRPVKQATPRIRPARSHICFAACIRAVEHQNWRTSYTRTGSRPGVSKNHRATLAANKACMFSCREGRRAEFVCASLSGTPCNRHVCHQGWPFACENDRVASVARTRCNTFARQQHEQSYGPSQELQPCSNPNMFQGVA